MTELTNEQRRCFGIAPVDPAWRRVLLKRSRYHDFDMFAYLEGDRIRHWVCMGEQFYQDSAMDAMVSPDGALLLPQTGRGKPVPLSAATLMKRKPVGMVLKMNEAGNGSRSALLYSSESDQEYYCGEFSSSWEEWVDGWCADTTEQDLTDVAAFALRPRLNVKYREGDYFRFRIGRREYGYGRLLINYDEMRRRKIAFWDQFMGKPLLVVCYRIITEKANVPVEELDRLDMLPPVMMMDNALFYGNYEIIGHAPVDAEQFDCPVHYGRSISVRESQRIIYQCGRTYRCLEGAEPLAEGFRMGSIGWEAMPSEAILRACVEAGSNEPYWQRPFHENFPDLRDPKHVKLRRRIERQMGVER